MKTKHLLFLISFFIFTGICAQQIPQTFQGKTHMLSEKEMQQLKSIKQRFSQTAPPSGSVRSIAEFERSEGVIVTYTSSYWGGGGFGLPLNVIAEMSEDAIVYTVVKNQSVQNTVTNLYNSNGVTLSNVVFVKAPSDSYWSRDYSPWFIANNNEVAIVDFPYNRPRPNDNNMPVVFGQKLNLDVYGMNLTSTGGNYMSDGMGAAASCDLVYSENSSLSHAQVKSLVSDYLGVTNYHVVSDPLGAYIKHIDCWGKFLDVDKILITKVPQSDPKYSDFEAMANYWANQQSSYGNNYQVYRVYSPNGQPYTNSLILNDKVLVPIVSGTGSSHNQAALNVYQAAMPGYEVIGFHQLSSEPWQKTDALHCRTHEVPDRKMLYIKHTPTQGTVSGSSVNISANVVSYAGNNINQVKLFYKKNNGSYTSTTLTIGSGNNYSTTLNLSTGDNVSYYIKATDATGKVETHPFIGASDPHKFTIGRSGEANMKLQAEVDLDVFPNPTSDLMTITIANFDDLSGSVKLKNINGVVVLSENIDAEGGWFMKKFNVSHLASGLYILTVEVNDELISKKVLIK
ncbi:MAG: agmatine deiminase family protein [Bacteroidales bacterium]|nr:agmatine deiminase family protein [Bacteroidales bacterium]